MLFDPKKILLDNESRNKELHSVYNPVTGEGSFSIERAKVRIKDSADGEVMWLPRSMMGQPLCELVVRCKSFKSAVSELHSMGIATDLESLQTQFAQLRFKYDFEYWAYACIRIKPKVTSDAESTSDIPFLLNRGQRRYLKTLLDMHEKGMPIRIVLLKARQWGGSTLTQIFMLWMQMVLHTNWNSVICAHVENISTIIQGMLTRALEHYPTFLVDGLVGGQVKLRPYMRSSKTREIKERSCRISVGSSEKPENIRGEDVNMVHFSEVTSFVTSAMKTPEDLTQSIVSGIQPVADTMVVYESTAKGVGNYFHRLWLDSRSGTSGYEGVFISWFDIESYALPIDDLTKFISEMDSYDHRLFKAGATLEQINWYHAKRKEYKRNLWRFYSEFPSFPEEAFQSSGNRYYDIDDVDKLRRTCTMPSFVGDLIANDVYGTASMEGVQFKEDVNGKFKIWAKPDSTENISNRYVVVMDVNRGTSNGADNGIICVIDRYWQKEGGVPEVVAEWCGHIMMRYFIWKGVQIAKWYNNAFLIVEANTPVSTSTSGFEMESVMDEIAAYYPNQYCRTPAAQIAQGLPRKWGFWTDRSTKMMVCSHQQIVIHNDMYIERCLEAANEHDTFEVKKDGSLGAVEGSHDDRHITRAIGIWACYKHLPPPVEVNTRDFFTTDNIINESSF